MDMSAGLGISGLTASIGVGLVYMTAGLAKFRHRALLEGVVANYRILPQSVVAPTALALPYAEMALGAALIVGLGIVPVVAGIALLLAFAAAMAVNIRRGRTHVDCGCGLSHLRQHLGWPLVARNLILASLVALRLPATPPLSGAEVAAAAVGGLALFLCTLLFNAIDGLSQSSAAAFRRHAP
jgi:hypothetical protein